MATLLVVDDERSFLRALSISLKAQNYDVIGAATGEEALAIAGNRPVDLLVLDLGLPSMDGMAVIAELRTWTPLPILVLSARGDVADAVAALDAGADDFLAKPFAITELLARIRVQLRRSRNGPGRTVVVTDHFSLDLAARTATAGGQPVHLTSTEWRVLDVLIRHEGEVVPQEQVLSEVWGPRYVYDHAYVRVFMATLRRKLEAQPSRPCHLLTSRGLGYRFVRDPEALAAEEDQPIRPTAELERAAG